MKNTEKRLAEFEQSGWQKMCRFEGEIDGEIMIDLQSAKAFLAKSIAQAIAEERERVVGVDKTCTIAEHIPSEEGEVCECGYFRKSKGYDYCRYVRDKVSDFRNFKDDLKQIVIEDVPHQYQERLLDLAKVFPSREPPHIEKQVHIENLISKAIAEERERVMKILSAENYKLEEWYSSSERPDTLTHFEANQRNIKTRNEIQVIIDPLDSK